MRRRLGKNTMIPIMIIIVIITIMGIAYCLTENRKDKIVKVEPTIYQDLLAKYERILEDPLYLTYTGEPYTPDDLYYWIWRCVGNYPVCYCIKDLNDDGREELIIGCRKNDTPFERFGTVYREPCEPEIIYTYEDGDVKWSVVRSSYIIKLYEGGIVELIESAGMDREYFMYYQAGEEYKKLDTLAIEQRDGEEPHYYKYIHEGDGQAIDCEEVTEEEFHEIRDQYATSVEELEWKPLECVWEPENMLSFYDLEQILNGNLFEVISKFIK